MAAKRSIVLITGGNGGIGFELASQLMADQNKHVIIGSRSVEKGNTALKDLESRNKHGSVEMLQLDVNSVDSVTNAAKKVEGDHGRLDALVNNAALASFPKGTPIHEQMRAAFETNCIGPQVMIDAFVPLLEKSTSTPRIINVTSGAGSISLRLDSTSQTYDISEIQYRSTKSALNMITANEAVKLGPKGMKVFSFCPGFTVSNLGPHNNEANGAKPTSEGARPMVAILNGERDAEHGGYLHGTGRFSW